MKIRTNHSLEPFNTFHVEAIALQFVEINKLNDLEEMFEQDMLKSDEIFILGAGSNILFTKNCDGLVLFNQLKGIEKNLEDEDHIVLSVRGGENWSELVDFTVDHGWGGLENLSLIPGTVGAAPVQNIGAYGVELKEVLVEVEAFDLHTGETRTFLNTECEFSYRDSIFKSKYRGRYFITDITIRLRKNPKINIEYTPLKNKFSKRDPDSISVKEVSNAVKEIRNSKLPDPEKLGNAGSFFKNPVVQFSNIEELIAKFPDMPFYKIEEDYYKVAAGWLIEKTGWKGRRIGDAGVHEKQALVLVNYGKATGLELLNLSEGIQSAVYAKFGITLDREVLVK